MKILQIAPYYPPYLGGQERHILNLSRYLVRMGHQVTVLTSCFPEGLPHDSEEDGVHIRRFPPLCRPFRNPIALGLLTSREEVEGADVIHAHNEHSFASNAAMLLKVRCHKPMVLTVHGRLILESLPGDLILRAYEQTVSRMVFRASDRITTAWAADRDRLLRSYSLPEGKLAVVPYGIDVEYWEAFQTRSRERSHWEEQLRQRKVILVATQLIKRKGIEFMIRAMPRILSAEKNAVLCIAGSGDQESTLRELADGLALGDRVLFLGRLFDEELSAAYRTADVFVLPSLSEGVPVCIMEAWAHGKPVVATRIDGTKDDFRDIALLVPPADPEALAIAVLRFLQDPADAAEWGDKGRRCMLERYSWPVVAEKMVAVYKQTLTGSGPAER